MDQKEKRWTMARKWQATKYPGVRFRVHPTRKHGVQFDRYFSVYYRVEGKRKEEGVGWSSQGMTAQKAAKILADLQEAHTTGHGAQTLDEQRTLEAEKRAEKERQRQEIAEREARENITFKHFFETEYLPAVQGIRKPESIRKIEEHVKNWIGPVIGKKPFHKITPRHLEKIRSNLVEAGRSPRTIQYVMASFRVIWNKARTYGLVFDESPTKKIEMPRVSNTRQRYLKQYEAKALLEAVRAKSEQTYQICLFSLHTGMRFSEITGLQWGHVDLDTSRIHIFNAKGDKDRTVPMTGEVFAVLDGLPKGMNNEYIFPSRVGGRIGKISKSFDLAVAELGLNDNVTDPKLRFSFHCLRHTHASWMIESGSSLYLVQKQLGHSTPVVTQRYSHVGDAQLEEACRAFEALIQKPKAGNKVNRLADRK